MPDDMLKQVTGFFSGLQKKADEAILKQEIALVRGKVAARAVLDDAGSVLVDAGHLIDDAVIQRAIAAGKLHALVGAAVTAQAQDLKERAQHTYQQTPEGQEKQSLASAEPYAEARRYLGRPVGVDVTDLRGNVLIPAGKELDDEDVRKAREADQLAALIYAAQQPLSPTAAPSPAVAPPPVPPVPGATAAPPRAARPLATYYEEEETPKE